MNAQKLVNMFRELQYKQFCDDMYDGKNDSYTTEKWLTYRDNFTHYLCSLSNENLDKFTTLVNKF